MAEKCRVLFLNHSIRHGGPGRSLYYLLKHLDRNCFDPYVLVPRHDVFTTYMEEIGLGGRIIVDGRFPENIMRTVGVGDGGGREVVRVSAAWKAFSVAMNVLALMWFVASMPWFLHRRRIDVIYCNGTLAKIVGAVVGAVSRRSVVWHVRNIQRTRVLRWVMGTLARLSMVRGIVCVSRATADQFKHVAHKVHIIYNGVDIAEFDPAAVRGTLRNRYGIPANVFVVGSTGRIVPRKGFGVLVDAASRLAPRHRRRIRFVVVGETPPYFRIDHLARLRAQVAEKGLDDMFVFTGYAPDVRPYLKEFDLFVITSNYPDPFPRSVIEAMAFGLPVVGFRQGGVAEAVVDGETGVLLEPHEPHRLAEVIERLAASPELRRRMGVRGRARVERFYEASLTARKVEEVLRKVTAGQWGGRSR